MEKKVSIIVPVYNMQSYLGECLESIRLQKWDELEVIVVDDGSVDNSSTIIAEYVRRDSRFHTINTGHIGPSGARNMGIEMSSGEFLTFVDADDYIEADYISNMVTGIGDSDLCISGFRVWQQKADIWTIYSGASAKLTITEMADNCLDYAALLSGVGWKLYRRELFTRHNLQFPRESQYGEDTVCFLRYISYSKNIRVLSYAGYVYRKHDQESLVKAANSKLEIKKKFLDELEEMYKQSQQESICILIAFWQMRNLLDMATQICYQTRGFFRRKKQFFQLADRYNIKSKCKSVKRNSRETLILKMTVFTHLFLPLNILIRLMGKRKEREEEYVK